jgi:N4-gp56 family major capsid protein
MAIDNFIPTLWAARLLANMHQVLVYGQPGIARRDYEGDLAAGGSSVKINSIGAVTVSDYTKNTDFASGPETLTDATLSLTIDQQKMFNFQVDDIDTAQQKPKVMDEAMREAGYAIAKTQDTFLGGFYTAAAAGNLIGSDGTPISITTAAAAYENLVDLGTKLDEADVPDQDRWVVVPPWFVGLIEKDTRVVGTGSAQAEGRLANGFFGRLAGFNVLKSNRVANTAGAKYKIMAGQGECLQFVEQVAEIKAYNPEKRFADAVKGLHVYGAKVIRPAKLAVLTANRT